MNHEGIPHDVLLPIAAVCEIVARSRASIYRDIKDGTFPKPQKQGRSSRWRHSLIMKVVEGHYPE
ncbi:helix-turn-helix transcriptional regulator [Alloyangia pacifica]|uniref:Transcriptional regulator, AlpA family n=1 Tax=Alloyangia pacifica TaxID=311180 RepID=A0A1I6VLX1_9RHOB|nr:AlpA family phage regulatory protein [Alloyangia pacifica]SDI05285.1 transcriptional regulator, AlpA family [Alloyangia pacifica]SFT14732.1 transcriptional regulator, AlpA family [Alloyangia pacifica]